MYIYIYSIHIDIYIYTYRLIYVYIFIRFLRVAKIKSVAQQRNKQVQKKSAAGNGRPFCLRGVDQFDPYPTVVAVYQRKAIGKP